MRQNTTPAEDKIISVCEEFGGVAADCVGIIDRLDALADELSSRIEGLEAEIEELEKALS